jgi:hypothetical protein
MKKLLIALTCLSLASCGMLWVYRGLNDIPMMTWKQTDIQTFDANIEASGNYDIYILFRHLQGFPYPEVAINFNLDGPDLGLSETYVIPVIGADRKYLGEAGGDIKKWRPVTIK